MSAFAVERLKKAQEKPGNSLKSQGVDMNKTTLLALILTSLLSGCEQSKPLKELTCKDDPKGRSKAEQMAIGDACFRRGSFHKSSGRTW